MILEMRIMFVVLIWPWSHTKLEKVQQVIQHYAEQKLENQNVIDFNMYRRNNV